MAKADPIEDLQIADESPGAEAGLQAGDEARRLAGCLGELDERTAVVIRTAFFEGVTYEALAQRLGAPLGTVKSWIRRGLARLKGCLER
jgi:RNA polymerase sigma-70 factor (ECF subfamily)